jgi:general secretion pathway protein G
MRRVPEIRRPRGFTLIANPRAPRGFIPIAIPRAPRGFTLIEILVVVVILGILAMIVVPRVMEEPGRARVVRAKQDIASIVAALNIYKLDNFVYPTSEQGLEALVTKPAGQPEAPNWSQRLDRVPKDPWGHPYAYQHPGQHGDIDVFSYGADGKPGGEGEAADIGNWDQ